ncbi:HopJ type III effector protein [Arenibacter palladensis]|uniref:HopJ type III effector protein n=1 Tax=Arenibacter palladensis TaxID=237373 RepID=UPI002FCF1BCE
MTVYEFLDKLRKTPEEITFGDTIGIIDTYYNFSPSRFTNGEVINEAGQNSGSCKVFSFAQHHKLSKEETLACFGSYYRKDVLENATGTDHQNIRNFMISGWGGISFDNEALSIK